MITSLMGLVDKLLRIVAIAAISLPLLMAESCDSGSKTSKTGTTPTSKIGTTPSLKLSRTYINGVAKDSLSWKCVGSKCEDGDYKVQVGRYDGTWKDLNVGFSASTTTAKNTFTALEAEDTETVMAEDHNGEAVCEISQNAPDDVKRELNFEEGKAQELPDYRLVAGDADPVLANNNDFEDISSDEVFGGGTSIDLPKLPNIGEISHFFIYTKPNKNSNTWTFYTRIDVAEVVSDSDAITINPYTFLGVAFVKKTGEASPIYSVGTLIDYKPENFNTDTIANQIAPFNIDSAAIIDDSILRVTFTPPANIFPGDVYFVSINGPDPDSQYAELTGVFTSAIGQNSADIDIAGRNFSKDDEVTIKIIISGPRNNVENIHIATASDYKFKIDKEIKILRSALRNFDAILNGDNIEITWSGVVEDIVSLTVGVTTFPDTSVEIYSSSIKDIVNTKKHIISTTKMITTGPATGKYIRSYGHVGVYVGGLDAEGTQIVASGKDINIQ